MHKFSDLHHRGWGQLSFCSEFICINKAEGDIKQKALKAYVGSLKTQLSCLAMRRQRYLSGRSFKSYLWFKFQFFLFIFPLLLFHFIEVMFNINNAILSLPPKSPLSICKANNYPFILRRIQGTYKRKKTCTGGQRPSKDKAKGL